MKVYLLIIGFFFSFSAWAKVAKVIILKNDVVAVIEGKDTKLKQGDWVDVGAVIRTGKKSFAKLLFIDKSQMALGPESEMEIKDFPKEDAGIISLVKGQLRSKVTKNYMEMKEKDRSKLFIKTKTAAMGVRGTDFQVNFNPINENTSLVTFEGAVAMAQIKETEAVERPSQKSLESLVSSDQAVIVTKGQFSGVSPKAGARPTIPVKINPAQLKVLEKNDGSQSQSSTSSSGPAKNFRAVIPPGVDSKAFSNEGSSVTKQLAGAIGANNVKDVLNQAKKELSAGLSANGAPPEGMVNFATGQFAPPAGGFIDLSTAQYIPPPPGSSFDPATQTYIPPANFGTFDPKTGAYKNDKFELTADGKFVEKAPLGGSRAPASVSTNGVNPAIGGLVPPPSLKFIPIDQAGVNFKTDGNLFGGFDPNSPPLISPDGKLLPPPDSTTFFFDPNAATLPGGTLTDDRLDDFRDDRDTQITDDQQKVFEQRTRVRFIIRGN